MQAYRDLTSIVRVSRCVRQEVHEYLLQTLGVRSHPRRLSRQRQAQLLASLDGFRLERLDRTAHGCAQIHAFALQAQASMANARNVEQVVDEPHHAADLSIDEGLRPPLGGRLLLLALQKADAIFDRS